MAAPEAAPVAATAVPVPAAAIQVNGFHVATATAGAAAAMAEPIRPGRDERTKAPIADGTPAATTETAAFTISLFVRTAPISRGARPGMLLYPGTIVHAIVCTVAFHGVHGRGPIMHIIVCMITVPCGLW